jgi:endonuclease G
MLPVSRSLLAALAVLFTTHSHAAADFAECPQFFANKKSPIVTPRPMQRALCYDAFAILHSGESKTAVYVAQKLNRASVADADEKRKDRFFEDARLPSAERAALDDYKHSGWSRGHMAPAGDMPTVRAMAQSFSLANMVPQAAKHNGGAWANSVEQATRKYASRASGDVYVITGPVYSPSIQASEGIGEGKVRVPKYLFKLVYDEHRNRAWAHLLRPELISTRDPKLSEVEYGEVSRGNSGGANA